MAWLWHHYLVGVSSSKANELEQLYEGGTARHVAQYLLACVFVRFHSVTSVLL